MYHHEIKKAEDAGSSKSFRSIARFLRHKITLGISMVAIGNLTPSLLLWYLSDLIEVADAQSFDIAQEYDRARMNNLIQESELLPSTDVKNKAVTSAAQASNWVNQILPTHDDALLKSIITSKLKDGQKKRSTSEDRPQKEKKSKIKEGKKADRSRSRGRAPKICFFNDPRNNKICSKGSECSNLHLDTTWEEIAPGSYPRIRAP